MAGTGTSTFGQSPKTLSHPRHAPVTPQSRRSHAPVTPPSRHNHTQSRPSHAAVTPSHAPPSRPRNAESCQPGTTPTRSATVRHAQSLQRCSDRVERVGQGSGGWREGAQAREWGQGQAVECRGGGGEWVHKAWPYSPLARPAGGGRSTRHCFTPKPIHPFA